MTDEQVLRIAVIAAMVAQQFYPGCNISRVQPDRVIASTKCVVQFNVIFGNAAVNQPDHHRVIPAFDRQRFVHPDHLPRCPCLGAGGLTDVNRHIERSGADIIRAGAFDAADLCKRLAQLSDSGSGRHS